MEKSELIGWGHSLAVWTVTTSGSRSSDPTTAGIAGGILIRSALSYEWIATRLDAGK